MSASPLESPQTPTRAIVFLGIAAFATQAMVRATDSLLPQIADDLDTTVGAASIVVTAYAAAHGAMQLFVGTLGDRLGKYVTVAAACVLSSVLVLMCGLAHSLTSLTAARLASGIAAAWIIPLAVTFVGDVVPYESRQRILGRLLIGQFLGQLFGQAAGGIIGDFFGWRAVFLVLAALFAVAAIALIREIIVNPVTRAGGQSDFGWRGMAADYRAVAANPWARTVLGIGFVAGAIMFGPFAFVGADLHLRFDLSFTVIGVIIAMFAVGALAYALLVKQLIERMGEVGLMLGGGLILALAYLTLAIQPTWMLAPIAVAATGLGFYMIQATLQTHSTQMVPRARGTAVSMFGSAFYLGQTAGVALAAPIVDHYGAPIVFAAAAVLFPLVSWGFAFRLRRR